MSKYKGLFTFDVDSHRYLPIEQADGIIDCMNYRPTEPLIKDEKIRKAVRAWAEAGGLEHFTVVNEHFNCCKIMGRKYNRVSKIEFLTTIPDATHRTYTIDELCGEEEAPEPLEPTFVDLDERIKGKEEE